VYKTKKAPVHHPYLNKQTTLFLNKTKLQDKSSYFCIDLASKEQTERYVSSACAKQANVTCLYQPEKLCTSYSSRPTLDLLSAKHLSTVHLVPATSTNFKTDVSLGAKQTYARNSPSDRLLRTSKQRLQSSITGISRALTCQSYKRAPLDPFPQLAKTYFVVSRFLRMELTDTFWSCFCRYSLLGTHKT
jgi:hypothetical protein